MDRLLAVVRDTAKQGRRRSSINNTALRKSIAVRTFGDWNDPAPGFMEWTWWCIAGNRRQEVTCTAWC